MGVAFWILPRFSTGQPRGNVGLIWASFALIYAGLLISIAQPWFSLAILTARIVEVAVGIIFVIGLWRRVKPHGGS
jgi:hypothetical protein